MGTASSASTVAAMAPCGSAGMAPATYDHVIWVWMENHSYQQVIGKSAAPYITGLAHACAVATDYHSVGLPSLPNYLGATSGDTWGIHDDGPPSGHVLTVDNLFRQVRRTGRSAVSYEDAMPGNCVLGSTRRYAVKHNPAAYYQGEDDRTACLSDNLPLGTADSGAFHDALASNSLPAFSFVTPDICNDMHSCPVATGDRWLSEFLPAIFASDAYRSGTTAVFVVWDEGNPMPFIAVAPTVMPGAAVAARLDHYALLRTTEEMLGITDLLSRAADAPSMRATFRL